MAGRYLENVILGTERGACSWLIRALLLPLSVLYRVGLALYLGLYRVGLRRRYRLPVTMLSVGNLTFGGTGKTPAVQAICELLLSQGLKVVVLSRGHGGSSKGCGVVSDGASVLMDSSEAGDEPVLLARALPRVPVVVGKDRRESGRTACRMFSPDIIVLDDGMQYWQLHRDVEIAVLDAARPFGSWLLMPAGDLREPPSGLRRADIVLLNNSSGMPDLRLRELEKLLARLASKAEFMPCSRIPVGFVTTGEAEMPLSWASGRKIVAFCGIGRPGSFFDSLRAIGADIAQQIEFPDHHAYTDADIDLLNTTVRQSGAEALVTTEKDLVRLRSDRLESELLALRVKLEIEGITSLADRINKARRTVAAAQAAD
jgi:tetraacyldisaccharide 4'-kinase